MVQREERRFEALYREHYDRVAAYLLSRADRELAREALARTFEIAWRRSPEMPEEPVPWLLGVARHVLLSLRRAQGRRDALVERIVAGGPVAPEEHVEVLARRELAAAALATLTDAQREVLLLIAWDGLTHQEAAAALGCSAPALRVRLHRARRRLRRALSELEGEEQAPASRPSRPGSESAARETHQRTNTSRLIKEPR